MQYFHLTFLLTVECMCRKGLRSSYLSTDTKFERATTLEYPLKPLWHIHFVGNRSSLSFVDSYPI